MKLIRICILVTFCILASTAGNVDAGEFDGGLIEAVKKGDAVAVNKLLQKGANVNTKDKDGIPAITLALCSNNIDVVRLVIEKVTDINAKGDNGGTALMTASVCSDVNIVGFLLSHGSDVHKRNNEKASALMLAVAFERSEIIYLLKEKGAVITGDDVKTIDIIKDRVNREKRERTKLQIAQLERALDTFLLDTGRYPTTAEGLNSLMADQGIESWSGPYITNLSKDSWDNSFQYLCPGLHGEYDLFSYGIDGKPGGKGADMDITNWE